MKKLLSLTLVLVMVLSMTVTAFADGPCFACDGKGYNWCLTCQGKGTVETTKCGACGGSGTLIVNGDCSMCQGTGKKLEDCPVCCGQRSFKCEKCNGSGEIHTTHSYVNGICSVCNIECSHAYENGICTVCNIECSHAYENGICTVCGVDEFAETGSTTVGRDVYITGASNKNCSNIIYAVGIEWTITDGVYTSTQNYRWNPQTMKYEEDSVNKSFTTAPSAVITVTSRSNAEVGYKLKFVPETGLDYTFAQINSFMPGWAKDASNNYGYNNFNQMVMAACGATDNNYDTTTVYQPKVSTVNVTFNIPVDSDFVTSKLDTYDWTSGAYKIGTFSLNLSTEIENQVG